MTGRRTRVLMNSYWTRVRLISPFGLVWVSLLPFLVGALFFLLWGLVVLLSLSTLILLLFHIRLWRYLYLKRDRRIALLTRVCLELEATLEWGIQSHLLWVVIGSRLAQVLEYCYLTQVYFGLHLVGLRADASLSCYQLVVFRIAHIPFECV